MKRSKSTEKLFIGLESATFESFFFLDPEAFLKSFAPARLAMLKRLLRKIGFNFKGSFIVDLTMPMNIGGYFAPNEKIIAINPMLMLYGTEKDIAHVLFHEGLHAGIYTDAPVEDEALVETMTKKKIADLYGGVAFKSGYDNLVENIAPYFGDMSFDEMMELVEGGDEDTFNNILEVIIVDPSIDEGVKSLSWDEIKRRLGTSWTMLQKMFPRMMNSLAGKHVGPHMPADMSLAHFELDGILAKTARKVLESNQELLNEIFDKLANGNGDITHDDLVKDLYQKGFGYLYDFDKEFLDKKIEQFLMLNFVKNFKLPDLSLSVNAPLLSV